MIRLLFFLVLLVSIGYSSDIAEVKTDLQQLKIEHYRDKLNIAAYSTLPAPSALWTDKLIVIDTMFIPKGTDATFFPATFLMEAKSAIVVEGSLTVKGKSNRRVVFKNLPYKRNYDHFDETSDTLWSGIHVREGGKLVLDSVLIENARVGISNEGGDINLSCVSFENVTGNASSMDIVKARGSTSCVNFQTKSDVSLETNPAAAGNSHTRFFRTGTILSGIATVAGIAGYLVFSNLEKQSVEDGENAQSREEALRITEERDKRFALRNVSIGVAGGAGLSTAVMGICWVMKF